MTAYMLWLQDVRGSIKADNPGISVTDVSKQAGSMWKTVASSDKKVISVLMQYIHYYSPHRNTKIWLQKQRRNISKRWQHTSLQELFHHTLQNLQQS